MVDQLRNSDVRKRPHRERVARLAVMVLFVSLLASSRLAAQNSNVHYRYQGNEPPGAIGSWQLMRGGPLPGYFQPVEIRAPAGGLDLAGGGRKFRQSIKTPFRVGLLIAPVYRLRVTNIPLHEGEEVYPDDRGDRSPLSAGRPGHSVSDTDRADARRLGAGSRRATTSHAWCTWKIPSTCCPPGRRCKEQNWFDAGPGTNPVEVADRLGRPMAIIRLGGRVPDGRTGPDCQFLVRLPTVHSAAGRL